MEQSPGAGHFVEGCGGFTVIDSFKTPESDLKEIKKIHVKKLPADERHINLIIRDQLIQMGYEATSGSEERAPENVDAIFTYADRWQWDMTMFMTLLTIYVKNPEDGLIIAAGKSNRTTLHRSDPPAMVKETLESIFQQHHIQE